MEESSIYERLTEVFKSVFFDDHLSILPKTSADDIVGWDSANHINLIVAAETEFHMRFDTAELERLNTVGDMVSVIAKKGS